MMECLAMVAAGLIFAALSVAICELWAAWLRR